MIYRAFGAAVLLAMAISCSGSKPFSLSAATQRAGEFCQAIQAPPGAVSSSGLTGAAGATSTARAEALPEVTLPTLCLETLNRGTLRGRWSRITIDTSDSSRRFGCIRVLQHSGHKLGYDDSGDSAHRGELQLEPGGGNARFLLRADFVGEQELDSAFGRILEEISSPVTLDFFERACSAVCRASRAALSVTLDPKVGHPTFSISAESDADCPIVGSRSASHGGGGAAGNQGAEVSAEFASPRQATNASAGATSLTEGAAGSAVSGGAASSKKSSKLAKGGKGDR